jgi:rhamnose transport system permease protein
MRLENYTVNVINIVIGVLLVLSVMTTSLLGRFRSVAGRWRGGGLRPPGRRAPVATTPDHASTSTQESSTEERHQP